MKNGIALVVVTSLTALSVIACKGKPAEELGAKSGSGAYLTSASAIGTPVSAIVELSDLYRAPETYDAKITVLEVLRGAPAMNLLAKTDPAYAPAPNGCEYVLARIRFEFAARGAPGDKTWELTGSQFSAFSGKGEPYADTPVVPPEPVLGGALRSGNSRQGWLAFAVAREDKKPVMTFSPGNIWFRLF